MPDHQAAIQVYEKAALLGNSDAYLNLGMIYQIGCPGVDQNYEKSI